jgi:hypothetical protein
MAFFQCPSKVGELFRPGTGGMRLGGELSLDNINTGVTSIMFHVHLLKCTQWPPNLPPT